MEPYVASETHCLHQFTVDRTHPRSSMTNHENSKTASHDHDPYKGPNDTLRTRTRTTHTSSFYFLQGRRTVQPTIIMNLPREFCTIWTATPLVTPICQLPCRIPTTYSCLLVSYLRYRYPFKKSSRVRSRPSSPFFRVVRVGSFGPYPMLVSRKSGNVFIFSRSMLD